MAEYELPPLRIKIVGDGKDFRKATDAAIKEAKRLESELNKQVGNVSASIVSKSAAIAMNSVFKAIAKHAVAMSASVKISGKIGASDLRKAYRDVTKRFISNVATHVSALASALKPGKAGSWALGRAVRNAQSSVLKNLLAGITTVASSSSTLGKTTAQLSNAIRIGINKILRALAKAVRGAVDAAVKKIDVNKFAKNLKKAIERGVNKARITAAKPGLRGSGGRGSSSRGSGDSFLGDRADIYMHINAVRTLADAWRSPLNALIEYQNKIAALAPQMGGTANAEQFVRDMRNTQVGQVYGAEIATAASRLKPHMDEQTMKRMMQGIGDIAGGDAERFKGLGRALGDVMATGHLQGDELRQFQEQQFPLMDLLSKRTGKKTTELYEMMEKRQISSKAIVALMEAETSVGGKYAGFLNTLSQTLGAAVQRVKTFYEALQVDVMRTIADSLVKYVNKLASGLVYLTQWVNENRDLVRIYAEIAMKVSAAVLAFHVLGFTIALVRWQMHALYTITRTLGIALRVLRGVMLLTWAAANAPIVLVIAGIYGVVLAVQYLYDAIAGSEGGLVGALGRTWENIKKFAAAAIGFFYNIGHNSKVVSKYIYDNFWVMIQDLGRLIGRFAVNLAIDFSEAIKMWHDVFFALMGWMVGNAPTWGYSIAEGLWEGFAWLFKKVKGGMDRVILYIATRNLPADFAAYMAGTSGKITKGATDMPAAIGEIMNEYLAGRTNAMQNNWAGLGLQSPAMEGLKLDWENPLPAMQKAVMEKLGLSGIPDLDFSGGGVPGQSGVDINALFGKGSDKKGGKKADTPMAVRAGSAEYIDAWDSIRMAQGDPKAQTNAQIAANTGQTNVILNQIKQAMTKPSSNWTINAGPALP